MNWSIHSPHAHEQTFINELPNHIALSSAIDHGLSQSSSYSNGHYAQSTIYTLPPILPPPHHRAMNSTACKLSPASWDGAVRDGQRVDHMPSPRGFPHGAVPSPGAYQEYYAHQSRTQGGFSEPSVWSGPAVHLGALPAYRSPTIPQPSYSDKRTSIPNDPLATASSSPYPSRLDSALYGHPEHPPSAYFPWPPQPAALFGMYSAHPVAVFYHHLGAWPYHASSSCVPATHNSTDHPHPQHPHLPPSPYLSHPMFYPPIPHPSMQYPYVAPQKGRTKRGRMKRGGTKRGRMKRDVKKKEGREGNGEPEEGGKEERSEGEDKNGEVNDNGIEEEEEEEGDDA